MLRPLVNQPPITLFMATLGLAYVIEGAAQLVVGRAGAWPRSRHRRHAVRGRRRVRLSKFDLFAAAVAGAMVGAAHRVLPLHPRPGSLPRGRRRSVCRARGRAAAAAHLGHRLDARRASSRSSPGLLWGARLGVQFSLSLVVLKALPVLVLGGFDSILGAIVGGLLVGATEKLAEVYIGPFVGGGIESWFAYVVALGFPAGPAGGPVRPEARREGLSDVHADICPSIAQLAARRVASRCRSCWSSPMACPRSLGSAAICSRRS